LKIVAKNEITLGSSWVGPLTQRKRRARAKDSPEDSTAIRFAFLAPFEE
jgi:hypothetical protein